MSANVFNIAFGAFLKAGMDYATCAEHARAVVDALAAPSTELSPAPSVAVAQEPAVIDDAAQKPGETQVAFILRVCDGQWRTRDWLAQRIASESKHESAIRTCGKLVQNGQLRRVGTGRNPWYISVNGHSVPVPTQAELPSIMRDASDDLCQRENENQNEFLLRVCAGQWRSLEWLARRIVTTSPYPKGPAAAACNKLISAGRMESKGGRGTVCYRAKVTT